MIVLLKYTDTQCLRSQPKNDLLIVQHTKLGQEKVFLKLKQLHSLALKTFQKIKELHSQKKLINNYCTLVHIVVGHRPTGLYDVFVVAIKFSESIYNHIYNEFQIL